MKVQFRISSKRALGERLGSVLQLLDSHSLSKPRQVMLLSRENRTDLPSHEVVESAAKSGSDMCSIECASGSAMVRWVYGSSKFVPAVHGWLDVDENSVAELVELLNQLASETDASYGYCERESLKPVVAGVPDQYGPPDSVAALHGIYWYNYFGSEYRIQLDPNRLAGIRGVEARDVGSQGFLVLTRASPGVQVDEKAVHAITRAWAVFRKYDPKATFSRPVVVDYSEPWRRAAPPPPVAGPIAHAVGEPDEFIRKVPEHAERFEAWLRKRGLRIESEEQWRQTMREHGEVIQDEKLVIPAIAAYGERVRRQMDGVWRKALLLHRGEPVVAKKGQPWSSRRVVVEALEAIEGEGHS